MSELEFNQAAQERKARYEQYGFESIITHLDEAEATLLARQNELSAQRDLRAKWLQIHTADMDTRARNALANLAEYGLEADANEEILALMALNPDMEGKDRRINRLSEYADLEDDYTGEKIEDEDTIEDRDLTGTILYAIDDLAHWNGKRLNPAKYEEHIASNMRKRRYHGIEDICFLSNGTPRATTRKTRLSSKAKLSAKRKAAANTRYR